MASPLSPDSRSAEREAGDWPGRRLGLPASGPRSVARLGRRVAALVIDWGLAYLLAWVFFTTAGASPDAFTILAIFAILQIVFWRPAGLGCGDRRCARFCCASASPRSSGTATSVDSTTDWPEQCSCAASSARAAECPERCGG